jgi:MFS family permease
MRSITAKPPLAGHPLRAFDYFSLNVYWFALSYLWNSMGPIILPTLVAGLVPDSQKGSALGLVTAVGLIIAVVVQPAAGAWTDRRTTRWGSRRPFIVGGTLSDAVFLFMLAFSGSYLVLLVAYALFQASSNTAHGPYQGYIPQLVPQVKHGKVSGVARFMEIIGIIVTSLLTGSLVGNGQIAAAIGVIVSGLLGAVGALLMISATTLTQVLIYGGIIGISIGIFLSVDWARATDLIPAEGGGRYLGISNLATAGSGVLAAGGGFLLDHFNAEAQNLGYTGLFLSAAACYLFDTAIAGVVHDPHRKRPPR